MRPLLDKLGMAGSAGQSPVAFPCSFAVSLPATASILQAGTGGGATSAPGTPDLLAASDTGASAADNVTGDTTPTFRIALPAQAIAGDTVRVYRAGATEIGSEALDAGDVAAGFVDVTAAALPSGGHSIAARVENGAGLSPPSAGLAVTVDTAAPDAPTAIVVAPVDQGSGPLQTDDTQPTFRVALPANAVAGDVATLEIDTAGEATAAMTAGDVANGYVDIQSANLLADDTLYDISAFITDAAGNQGASSAAVAVEVGDAGGNAIAAVVYDGATASMRHTGGLGGVADGTSWTGVWIGKVNSNGSAMSFRRIVNGSGAVFSLRRLADDTIEFKGWQPDAATAVFSCVTGATVTVADGLVAIFYGCRGTHAALAVVKPAGTSTGANTPGAAGDIDFTADDFLGQDGASGEWLDADQYLHWGHNIWMDPHDREWRDQFYDRATNLLRDVGAIGSNPLGAVTQPLMCHNNPAASHVGNKGAGGDADNASAFVDGASPGGYQAALVNGFDLFLTAEGWWSADHSANLITSNAVETLADRTANSNHAAQSTAGRRPTLTLASGLYSMEFDGAEPSTGDDVLTVASPTATLANNFATGGTTAQAYRHDGVGESSAGRVWNKDAGSENYFTAGGSGVGGIDSRIQFDYATSVLQLASRENGTQDPVAGDKLVTDVRYSKAAAVATDAVFGMNGVDMTTGGSGSAGLHTVLANSGAAVDPSNGSFSIGNNSAGTRTFDGGIYELALWDSKLSDANTGRLRTHLGRKYDVTIS